MAVIHDKAHRGRTQMGWLDSYHTFSFSGFRDPGRMGHGALRVINEDRVIPGAGFGAHRHADMDILTYVVSGALVHRDSLGNGSVIRPGEIQRMSAGTGIVHSETNASEDEGVHFLQIWIIPERSGGAPVYQQAALPEGRIQNGFGLIAGPDGSEAPVDLISDTRVHLAKLADGTTADYAFVPGRLGFVQIVDGSVEIDGEALSAGDGLAFADWKTLEVVAQSTAELLLFDLKGE